jgi:hypothetical protein
MAYFGNVEKSPIQGLFKNVQVQGAQKPKREAYMDIR